MALISLSHLNLCNFASLKRDCKGPQPSNLKVIKCEQKLFDSGRFKKVTFLNRNTLQQQTRIRTRFNDGRLVVCTKKNIGEMLASGHNACVEFIERTFKKGETPRQDHWRYETQLVMNPDGETVDAIIQTKITFDQAGNERTRAVLPSYTII